MTAVLIMCEGERAELVVMLVLVVVLNLLIVVVFSFFSLRITTFDFMQTVCVVQGFC